MTRPERDRRFRLIREIGCLASRKRGWYVAPDVHHLNLGGLAGHPRLGDEYTIGLSVWHHRGIPVEGTTEGECRELLGPSMKHEPVAFREFFGSDDALLAWENELIERRDLLRVARRA